MPAATAPAGEAGQAPDPAAPQAGTGTAPQAGAPDGLSEVGITDVTVLQSELAKARKEAAEKRIELKTLKDADKARLDADLDEQTKLTNRTKELEAEVERLTKQAKAKALEAAVVKQSILLGIIDPDAAVKLLDTDALELDPDTGEPKNIEAALKQLIKDKPYLAQKPATTTPGSTNAGAGGAAGPAPNLTADELAAAQAAGMTPERYSSLKTVRTLDDWRKTQPAKT